MEILEGVPEFVSFGICEYRNSCNNELVTRQFLPHANTASDGVPTAKISYEFIMESLFRIAVSFLPIRLGVNHGTAASTDRTLCSTAWLLIFSYLPV